ncbi:MAG: hypothetical protein ABI564_14570 [Ideonella sp.]
MNSIRFDRRTEDIGNLVEFGHLNVRVPDQQRAIVFYVMGLGLTRDPYLQTGIGNAWINVGTSQFHLPTGPAQALRGVVHLVMPDLAALLLRLDRVRELLAGTRFDFQAVGERVELVCPWGNQIHVHAPDPARFGQMALGMPCLEVHVGVATSAAIARFYQEILASPASVGSDAAGAFVQIPVGLGESLRFREVDTAMTPYDGHHVQVTVADFSGVHGRLLERGLITEESDQSQYRFQDIVDLDSGAVVATIEHEVRSMRHPMFARPLVNRDPAIQQGPYVAAYETAKWQMPPRPR